MGKGRRSVSGFLLGQFGPIFRGDVMLVSGSVTIDEEPLFFLFQIATFRNGQISTIDNDVTFLQKETWHKNR